METTSNISKNSIEEKNKIETYENEISTLKTQIDSLQQENQNLNKEISKLYETLNQKNIIIQQFQELIQESTNKFEKYISNHNQISLKLDKKNKKYSELKNKFLPLNEK